MDVPILLLVWKRPIHTKRIIDSIRKLCPKKMYISADGPIKNDINNQRLVDSVRELIFKQIDWECKILTNFSNINKGCKHAVSDGITWFFKYEEEGIILEDDCLPNEDFFYFCESLLEKYRYDERIWAVCGNGYQDIKNITQDSYFFSRYADVWGWATWKRCWNKYDKDIKNWEYIKSIDLMKNIFEDSKELNFWYKIFDNLFYNGKPDTWDYQWQYLCFINAGMICMPFVNLVKNIGFDKDATHTKDVPIIPSIEISEYGRINFPIKHPTSFIRSKTCDKHLQNIFYSGYPIFSSKGFKVRLKKVFLKFRNLFF